MSPSAFTRVTNSSPSDTDRSVIRARADLVMTTSFSASCSGRGAPWRMVVARSIIRASTFARPASAASSDGYSSGNVASVRKPRLPKFTPRIGTSTSALAMPPATESSVPSAPSTTISSTWVTSSPLSASRRFGFGGISAAVAVSNTGWTPRASSHDSISVRCGIASRRCDLATIPTFIVGIVPSFRLLHGLDDRRERRIHRAVDAVLLPQRDDRTVHEVDLGRPASLQVLTHRGDIARGAERLGDRLDEILLKCHAVGGRHPKALVDHQPLQRVEAWVGDAANFRPDNRGDWIDDAVEDQLAPDFGVDGGRYAAVEP